MYLASDDGMTDIYMMDEEGKLTLYKEVVRGTKIVSLNNEIINDEVSYTEVEYEDGKYYIVSDNLVSNEKEVVLEDERLTSVISNQVLIQADILCP